MLKCNLCTNQIAVSREQFADMFYICELDDKIDAKIINDPCRNETDKDYECVFIWRMCRFCGADYYGNT